jgi:hypothetical protein
MGAAPIEIRHHELQFKTKDDGYMYLQPSSVNHCVTHFTSPYLVYRVNVEKSCLHTRLLGGSCADTSTFLWIYCHFSSEPTTVAAQRVTEKWGEKLATRSVTRYTWKARCRHQLSLVLYHRHISTDVQKWTTFHFVSHHCTWITQRVHRETSSSWSCEIFFMCDLNSKGTSWVLLPGNAHSRDSETNISSRTALPGGHSG